MTKGFKKLLSLGMLASLMLTLTACSTSKTTKPTHKAATSACLISSTTANPGSADRELAADLVEAQVVYGLKVREVLIPNVVNISNRLLTELQAGCVLLVSGNTAYLDSLSSFARIHSKIMVLFVGGQIAEADQTSNFRWIADDPNLGAKLAGFAAVEKGHDITLLYTANFAGITSMQAAFMKGVKAGEQVFEAVKITVHKVNSKGQFKSLAASIPRPGTLVALVNPTYLTAIADYSQLDVIGADLQLGGTLDKYDAQVFASIERKTSTYVLRAVSSLLARKVNSDPKYRVLGGVNELRVTAGLSDRLLAYKNQLLNVTP
jgi:hypothetical protein